MAKKKKNIYQFVNLLTKIKEQNMSNKMVYVLYVENII